MKIGRFFALGHGQVGQYLSARVLVVRTPFQKQARSGESREVCYFGFDKLSQAQKFSQYLARSGYRFQLRPGKVLSQYPYEVKLWGQADLTKVLATWDRLDQRQVLTNSEYRQRLDKVSSPEIAA
jgi:hypothetical protein